MTRRQKIGLAVLLLIVIVAICPFFAGWLFQYHYQKDVNNFNSLDQGHIEILAYKRGWYHSTAMLDIEVPLAVINFLSLSADAALAHRTIKLKLTQEISHGPFFYPHAENFNRLLGLAVIHNQWELPLESKQLLHEVGFPIFTVDSNNIYVSIFANYLIDMRLKIQSAEINLKSWFMPKQQRIQGKLQVKDIDLMLGDAQLVIPDITLSFNQKATELSLWTGKLDLNMKGLMWRGEDENIISLSDVHLLGETEKNGNFISLNRIIEIGKMQLNKEIAGPLRLQLNANKLNAKAISDLISTYTTITRRGELYRNQLKQKILLILPNVIYPGANLNLENLILVTPYGKIQANGMIFWPVTNSVLPDTMEDFVKEAPLNATLTVSAPLLKKILNLTAESPYLYPYSQEEKRKIIKLQTDADLNFKWNKQLLLQLGEAKIIDEDTETLLVLNSRQRDFSDFYLYKIKEMYLSREMPAYITYLLYFRYGSLLFNIDAIDDVVEKHVNNAKELMINILSKAVVDGLIHNAGDQYTTVITRENNEIKLNGKILTY